MNAQHSSHRTAPVTTSATASGDNDGIQIGADGTTTIKPAPLDPNLQKEADDVAKSGAFEVEAISGTSMGTGLQRTAAATLVLRDKTKPLIQRQQAMDLLLSGVRIVVNESITLVGGTGTDTVPLGATPAYGGLSAAAAAAADGSEQFPIELNNAHADPQFLREGGSTLDSLLGLSDMFTKAAGRTTLTTVPLARQLFATVGAVCQAAQPELPRNVELQSVLTPALTYQGAKAAKGLQTKAKITKAVKDKTAKETKPTTPAAPTAAGKTDLG